MPLSAPPLSASFSARMYAEEAPANLSPYAELKGLVGDNGFVSSEHERKWEEAWLGKMPLSTVVKSFNGEGSSMT